MASTITVSFSGTVNAAGSVIQGVTLTPGDAFSGSFSFDADALTASPNNSIPGFLNSVYTKTDPAGAIQLAFQVGSHTFSYDGSNASSVTLSNQVDSSGNQHFVLGTSNATPFSSISFEVVAPQLFTDAGDLNSLSFENLPGNLSFLDFNGSFTSGALQASSVTVATTPIPASLPLFLSAIAGLGWIAKRRRKAEPMPALSPVAA